MKQFLFLLIILNAVNNLAAQNVGIGTTTPNPSAILDVSSSNKGILLPRMTTVQRNAIVSPAVGLAILNTDDLCTDIFDGSNWIKNCGLKQLDSATITAGNWRQRANLAALPREEAVGFSIGNKGYIGTGSFYGPFLNDLWEYNPSTNSWSQKANVPGPYRKRAFSFSIASKGYVGAGQGDGSPSFSDFWEYDPSTNLWTQKNNFGGGGRVYATAFSLGNKGYAGLGHDASSGIYYNDFWEYDPSTNLWTQKANFSGGGRFAATGFSIGSKGYIGTGYDGNFRNDFWEYDPGTPGSLGTWTQKANFGGGGRTNAVGFSIGDKGYMGTGNAISDFWEYDPATNIWVRKADLPDRKTSAVGFSIGNKGYIGTGRNSSEYYTKDFWEYNQQPYNVANYTSNNSSLTESNVSDGIWTKTVFNEIISPNSEIKITQTGNIAFPGPNIATNSKVEFNRRPIMRTSTDGTAGIWFNNNDNSKQTGFVGMLDDTTIGLWGNTGAGWGLAMNTNNGNVGIGVTNPNARIQFANIAANRKLVLFQDIDNNHQFYGLGIGNSTMNYQISGSGASHVFYAGANATNSTELMRIKGNGNVGIGTTEPNAPLQFGNTTGTPNRKIVLYDANNNDNQFYGFGINTGTLRYQIAEANVGFAHKFYAGTSSTNSDLLLEINGLGNAWLRGTMFQASDARLKTNIHRMGNTLQNLQQLNGYTYNWISKDRDPSLQTGLLAQELQKIYPQLVKEDEMGILSINYSGLIPVLLEAIKEQQTQINELKKLVQQLLNK